MSDVRDRLIEIRKYLSMTQTKFAESLGVGIGVISNLERGLTELKPQFASLICDVHGINKEWLETGEGNMFSDMTREIKIAQFVGEAMKEESTFKHQLIALLSELDEDGWRKLDEAAHALLDAQEQIRKSRNP